MRLGPNSITGVLILVTIAVAQPSAYSHIAILAAQVSVLRQQHAIGNRDPPDDWSTYHRDTVRSGYDPATPQITSVSLNWKSTPLDGDVYAEPLIVGGEVIVATENNSLYELNATNGQTIWHINLGTPVNGGVLPCGDINPSGITGTPVIDVAGRTIFVVAFLQATNGTLHHELFAIDLDTGNVSFQLPIDPSGSNPLYQQQRAALALSNGYVYVAYGGLDGDCGPYHGWLAATNENGGGPVISYQVPTGRAGAIWGGGDGPVVDQSGDLLVATGNSDAASTFDFGDSVMKLSPATSPPISVLDWFAPSNWAGLNGADLDLGSTEPVILSSNYLFQIGKEGVGYLLNATKLGGIGGQLYSSQVCSSGHGAYGGLAYASPYLVIPCDNGLVMLKINLGSNPPFTVVWRSPNFLAGPPIIAGNAIWDVDASSGLIYALSLSNRQTLFHDTIGSVPTHFNSISAGDGQIFVSASRQVLAYLPQPLPMTLITGVDAGQGSVSPTCSSPSGCNETVGSSVTVTATPSSGWQFSSWSTQTGISCTNNPCSFTMPNTPVAFGATFVLIPSLRMISGFTSNSSGAVLLITGDLAVNPHGTKPSGVGFQAGRDTTPLGFISGMLSNTQPYSFDTNPNNVVSSGLPIGSWPLVISVGGPLINAVTHYYETTSTVGDRAPVSISLSGSNWVWTARNGTTIATVPASSVAIPPGTSDVFYIQIVRDSEGRLVVLLSGTSYLGTWAAAWYFKNVIYPNISTYTNNYIIIRWTDASSGASADFIPDNGDTFTVIAQGTA